MTNSRAKGNRAERAIIKILNQHFPGPFERRTMGLPGADIMTPDEFHWAVEIKDNVAIKLKHIWKPNKRLIESWAQAKDQAAKAKKTPLLVVKIEGLWFCWYEVPHSSTDGYDFANTKWLFTDWCENHKP